MAEQNTSKTSERAEALARVAKAEGSSLSYCNAFLIALERREGYTTPVEEFLRDVVLAYEVGRLTPEWAKAKLEEFTDNQAQADALRDRILSEQGMSSELPERPAHPESPLDAADLKLGKLLEAVTALDERDREHVWDFLTVAKFNLGNGPTPVENAICEMAEAYADYYSAVTSPEGAGKWRFGLESLQRKIDEAKEWMDDSINGARHIARVYPYLLEPEGDNAGI